MNKNSWKEKMFEISKILKMSKLKRKRRWSLLQSWLLTSLHPAKWVARENYVSRVKKKQSANENCMPKLQLLKVPQKNTWFQLRIALSSRHLILHAFGCCGCFDVWCIFSNVMLCLVFLLWFNFIQWQRLLRDIETQLNVRLPLFTVMATFDDRCTQRPTRGRTMRLWNVWKWWE